MTEARTRTKADFKALREEVGISQESFAKLCDVRVLTVKRWEKDDGHNPVPPGVWDILDSLVERWRRMVDNMVKTCLSEFEAHGDHPKVVTLTYYRNQDQYDEVSRDLGPYGVVNGASRAAATELRRLGFEVRYEYPDSSGNASREAMAGRG